MPETILRPIETWRRTLRMLLTVSALLTASACGGSGGGGITSVPPVDPTGEWSVTVSETSSTCGPLDPSTTQGVYLTLLANGTQLDWQDEDTTCDPASDFAYVDNSITESFSEAFDGPDGCTYREDINGTVQFMTNSLSGSFSTRYTTFSGTNRTDLRPETLRDPDDELPLSALRRRPFSWGHQCVNAADRRGFVRNAEPGTPYKASSLDRLRCCHAARAVSRVKGRARALARHQSTNASPVRKA